MRVLMAAQYVGPSGGAGAHVADSVSALERAGLEVVPVVMQRDPAVHFESEVHLVPGLGEKQASPEARDAFLELIRDVRPDVVHIQQMWDSSLIEIAGSEAPVVFDVHNYVVCTSGWKYFRRPGQACHRPHGSGCLPNLALRGCAHTWDPRELPAMYQRTTRMVDGLRRADAVVGHSRYVVDQLRLNGIARSSIVPLFVTPRPEVTPVPQGRKVLFSGRVTAAKGLGTLLRAAARINARVHVCGDGWWLPEARKLTARLDIERSVEFSGWCSPGQLSRAYRDATLVAVPSHWPEPFGLVGIEAMAHGRPVVASNGGGIPEWLSDGVTGLLVPPGDVAALSRALGELLDDPRLSARMGAAGAEAVHERFSEDRYLEAITDAYGAAREHWRGSAQALRAS